MNIKGRLYRAWSRFIHKYGYHHAPAKPPIEGTPVTYGIDGKIIRESTHWCEWCGLRGKTFNNKPKSERKSDEHTRH